MKITFAKDESRSADKVYYSKQLGTCDRQSFYRIHKPWQGIWWWCEVFNQELGMYQMFAHAWKLPNAKRFCNMHANDEPLPYQCIN